MAIATQDSRLQEADLAFSRHVQRGAPPKIVEALLPMLVGPDKTSRAAESWLARHAYVGHDISPEGEAQDRVLLSRAKALHGSALQAGQFAGRGPVFQPPAGRYNPSASAIDAELGERGPATYGSAHGRRNANVVAASDAERKLADKHGPGVKVDVETGKAYKWISGERRQVDQVDLPGKRHLNDVSHLQGAQSTDANLSNPDDDDDKDSPWLKWGAPMGVDVPFFLQP